MSSGGEAETLLAGRPDLQFARIQQISIPYFHADPRDYPGCSTVSIFPGSGRRPNRNLSPFVVRKTVIRQYSANFHRLSSHQSIGVCWRCRYSDSRPPLAATTALPVLPLRSHGCARVWRSAQQKSYVGHLPRLRFWFRLETSVRPVRSSRGDPTIPRGPTKEIIPVDTRPLMRCCGIGLVFCSADKISTRRMEKAATQPRPRQWRV